MGIILIKCLVVFDPAVGNDSLVLFAARIFAYRPLVLTGTFWALFRIISCHYEILYTCKFFAVLFLLADAVQLVVEGLLRLRLVSGVENLFEHSRLKLVELLGTHR